jgi:hypothetical protein
VRLDSYLEKAPVSLKMKVLSSYLLSHLVGLATAQLIGPVGPTTPLSHKTRQCNVLHYGAVNDNSTDIADALELTFRECVLKSPGSRLVVPEGEYLLNRSVVLSNATNWAFQLEGLITLAYGGNYSVSRELILQGHAGVQPLNDTINGEGDHLFLENGLVIVNGTHSLRAETWIRTYTAQPLTSNSTHRLAKAPSRARATSIATRTSSLPLPHVSMMTSC